MHHSFFIFIFFSTPSLNSFSSSFFQFFFASPSFQHLFFHYHWCSLYCQNYLIVTLNLATSASPSSLLLHSIFNYLIPHQVTYFNYLFSFPSTIYKNLCLNQFLTRSLYPLINIDYYKPFPISISKFLITSSYPNLTLYHLYTHARTTSHRLFLFIFQVVI